jgi:hypothetical protein
MSFSGHAILALHVAAVIFAIGPGTAAIMSTPRHIRRGNVTVVRHLYGATRIYSAATILVLVFGLILAGMQHDFGKWWVSVSTTLFVVAAVLLVLIMRDQRKAITALGKIASPVSGTTAPPVASASQADSASTGTASSTDPEDAAGNGGTAGGKEVDAEGPDRSVNPVINAAARVAAVERGRIASLSGIVGLIWLVTLVLMVFK